jgi:hypothetical protein
MKALCHPSPGACVFVTRLFLRIWITIGRPPRASARVFVPTRQVRSSGFIPRINSSRRWRFWKRGCALIKLLYGLHGWSTGVHFGVSVLKRWKKIATLGTSIMNKKYTDKKILVSVRTPEDITIIYLNCIPRVARKGAISFVTSACRPVRVKQLFSQWIDFCYILYWEILLQFFWENASWVHIGQNIRHFTCDLFLLLEETTLGRNKANMFALDCRITSRGR